MLAPMRPELKAAVRAARLNRSGGTALLPHAGKVGSWTVLAGVIGMGPAVARQATERVLADGPFDRVVVVGIAGGLDPALRVGDLMVPERVRLHPDGPLYLTHPLPGRIPSGGLMTTDGLFSAEEVWRPILESGFGAVDMEAAGVAEACEGAGVAWSVYRGISDRPDAHLVDDGVFALAKPDGSADIPAVIRYLAKDPRRARTLARLNRDMIAAADVAARAAVRDLARSG
jgi:adenosylhomocysteine nucleosidase